MIEWLNQNLQPSTPGLCSWCGRSELSRGVVLPFGTNPGAHAWLHGECWPAWHQANKSKAVKALQDMGAINLSRDIDQDAPLHAN